VLVCAAGGRAVRGAVGRSRHRTRPSRSPGASAALGTPSAQLRRPDRRGSRLRRGVRRGDRCRTPRGGHGHQASGSSGRAGGTAPPADHLPRGGGDAAGAEQRGGGSGPRGIAPRTADVRPRHLPRGGAPPEAARLVPSLDAPRGTRVGDEGLVGCRGARGRCRRAAPAGRTRAGSALHRHGLTDFPHHGGARAVGGVTATTL
ncbi:MAG: 16S rRNA (guanine(527)-N(7))-methyltransferase, partial [uncultured Nocardioidaceae bacterium]